jgi:hypothetical protein
VEELIEDALKRVVTELAAGAGFAALPVVRLTGANQWGIRTGEHYLVVRTKAEADRVVEDKMKEITRGKEHVRAVALARFSSDIPKSMLQQLLTETYDSIDVAGQVILDEFGSEKNGSGRMWIGYMREAIDAYILAGVTMNENVMRFLRRFVLAVADKVTSPPKAAEPFVPVARPRRQFKQIKRPESE